MRSRWKNSYVSTRVWNIMHTITDKDYGYTKDRAEYLKKATDKTNLLIHMDRASTILPVMDGYSVGVHNGRNKRMLFIRPIMFGNKLGEYVATKARCVYRRRKNKKGKKRCE